MDWAPNFNQTTQQWQPEWVCLRCSNTITPDQPSMQQAGPAPHCPTHGPRSLAVDLRQNERGWVCSRGYPPHILSCEPMQIPNPAISAPDEQHQRPTQTQPGPWFRQRPAWPTPSSPTRQLLVLCTAASRRGAPVTSRHRTTMAKRSTGRTRVANPCSNPPSRTPNPVARSPQHTSHTPATRS